MIVVPLTASTETTRLYILQNLVISESNPSSIRKVVLLLFPTERIIYVSLKCNIEVFCYRREIDEVLMRF